MAFGRRIVLIDEREWDDFLKVVEALVDAHVRLLRGYRELRLKNEALKEELREALGSATKEVSGRVAKKVASALRPVGTIRCPYCEAIIAEGSRFCDRCGRPITQPISA